MRLLCPQCHTEITVREFPALVGKTLCASCRKHSQRPFGGLHNAPRGAWFKEYSNGFEVGASMGSPMKLLLVPFACLWIAGSVALFFKSVASSPGCDIWLRAFAWVLVAGVVYFGGVGVFSAWGKVIVRRRGDTGEVFSGIGNFGYRRRFQWSEVQSMRVFQRYGLYRCQQVAFQGKRTIRFGSRLGPRELKFMLGALRQFDRKRHPARDIVVAMPAQRRLAAAVSYLHL